MRNSAGSVGSETAPADVGRVVRRAVVDDARPRRTRTSPPPRATPRREHARPRRRVPRRHAAAPGPPDDEERGRGVPDGRGREAGGGGGGVRDPPPRTTGSPDPAGLIVEPPPPSGETKPNAVIPDPTPLPEANPNPRGFESAGSARPTHLFAARTITPHERSRDDDDEGRAPTTPRAPDGERAGGGPRGDEPAPLRRDGRHGRAEQRGATRGGVAIRPGAGRQAQGVPPRRRRSAKDAARAGSKRRFQIRLVGVERFWSTWSMFRCPAAGFRTRATKRSAGTGTGNRAFDLLLERGSPLDGAVIRQNRGQVRRAVAAVRGPVLARPPRRRSRRAARILRPVRGAATRSRREGDVGSNAFDPRVRDRRLGAARRGRGGQRAHVARARHVPHPRHRPPHAVRRGRDDLLLPRPPIRKTRGTEAQPLLRTAARRRARGAKPSRFRRGGIGPRPRPEGDSSDSSDYSSDSSDSSARRYARSGVARVSPSFELSSLEGRLRRDGSELGEDRGDGARGEADGGHRRRARAPGRARAIRRRVLGEEPRIERRRALHPAPRLPTPPRPRGRAGARGPGPRDGRRGRNKRVGVRARRFSDAGGCVSTLGASSPTLVPRGGFSSRMGRDASPTHS